MNAPSDRAAQLMRATVLTGLYATLVVAADVRPTAIPLPSNRQTSCTPTYLVLWDDTHKVPTPWATWEGNVTIIGCLEQLVTLSAQERARAQVAFDVAIREQDLHLVRSSTDGPMRAMIARRVNAAVGRVVVTDWLLGMSRGEAP